MTASVVPMHRSPAVREAWAKWEQEARQREPSSSHIPGRWITVAAQLGKLAAHGDGDRFSFESCLMAWVRLQPGLKGGSADFLCHLFEQAQELEEIRIGQATLRVRRTVLPLFLAEAPREVIWHAAERAGSDVLSDAELRTTLSQVLDSVKRRRRSRR